MLGMSLSALLDIPAAHDFLRGLLSLMQEFEGVPDDKFDRKNVSFGEGLRKAPTLTPTFRSNEACFE